jgi:hypothetical protein
VSEGTYGADTSVDDAVERKGFGDAMRRGAAVGVEGGADRLLLLVARERSAVGAGALGATVGEVVDHGEGSGEWRVKSEEKS